MTHMRDHARQVTVRPLRWSVVSTEEWDGFASRCDASHHGALGHLRFLRLKGTVLIFELFDPSGGKCVKFGQCAVLCGRVKHFVGGLHLLPESRDKWKMSMAAVLHAIGPGHYEYGSKWDVESRRDSLLQTIDGVAIDRVQPYVMQVVEFERWCSWDKYYRDLSKNARRNANSLAKNIPNIGVTLDFGMQTTKRVQYLTILRALMFRRKRLSFSFAHEWMRAIVRCLLWRRHAVIATVRSDRKAFAMLSCIEFGANTYFLEAGSRHVNHGAAWYLMLFMLQRAFQRNPKGRFVMGVVVDDVDLTRSREQCCVSAYAISTTTFTYAAL